MSVGQNIQWMVVIQTHIQMYAKKRDKLLLYLDAAQREGKDKQHCMFEAKWHWTAHTSCEMIDAAAEIQASRLWNKKALQTHYRHKKIFLVIIQTLDLSKYTHHPLLSYLSSALSYFCRTARSCCGYQLSSAHTHHELWAHVWSWREKPGCLAPHKQVCSLATVHY